MTRFDRVEVKVFFVEELYWKMHRIVSAKLEYTLDVNDNDKSKFNERMNRYFIKLLFLPAVVYFKSFNTNTSLHNFIRPLFRKMLLLLSFISNRFSLS